MAGGKKTAIIFILFAVTAGAVMVAFSLTVASVVKKTNRVEFCASCHEMGPFYRSWQNSAHGSSDRGVLRARCVDCHLPYTNVAEYLYRKATKGISHYSAHLRGKAVQRSPAEKMAVRGEFDRGCRNCHKSLIAPEISLKAFRAHRAYLTEQTSKSCVACHTDTGHKEPAL